MELRLEEKQSIFEYNQAMATLNNVAGLPLYHQSVRELNNGFMRSIKIITIIFFVLGLSSTVSAQQTSDSIKMMLEARDTQIKTILGPKGSEYTEAQRDTLKSIINGIIDFEAMSKGST